MVLSPRQLSDLDLLLNGRLSPLRGFLGRADYDSVLDTMRLESGLLWPVPVTLDVPDATADANPGRASPALPCPTTAPRPHGRSVTLLDGEIVRRNLSSELGLSCAHRDLNMCRIGFVASEITKNGVIALCALIAPLHRHPPRRAIARPLREGAQTQFAYSPTTRSSMWPG